jgi:nitrite reductase (NO-forming)
MNPVLAAVQPGPKQVTLTAKETTVYVAKDVAYTGWSFEGTIPGTPVRLVVGDQVTVTVRNEAQMSHSLDTHAAQTPPDVNYPVIQPGQEFTWTFTPSYPGAYMYHCGTPPVLMHIAAGMYGAMIVDPPGGWPPAQELVLVQSEFYLADGPNGVKTPDFAKMMQQYGAMDYVTFNGYANQYVENPIPVKVGEPIRIFVVNAGPNVWSSFHVVGGIFDATYANANPANKLVGQQSVSIGPGDGACVELTLKEPGIYPAVNHAFGHAQHGAIALLQAS